MHREREMATWERTRLSEQARDLQEKVALLLQTGAEPEITSTSTPRKQGQQTIPNLELSARCGTASSQRASPQYQGDLRALHHPTDSPVSPCGYVDDPPLEDGVFLLHDFSTLICGTNANGRTTNSVCDLRGSPTSLLDRRAPHPHGPPDRSIDTSLWSPEVSRVSCGAHNSHENTEVKLGGNHVRMTGAQPVLRHGVASTNRLPQPVDDCVSPVILGEQRLAIESKDQITNDMQSINTCKNDHKITHTTPKGRIKIPELEGTRNFAGKFWLRQEKENNEQKDVNVKNLNTSGARTRDGGALSGAKDSAEDLSTSPHSEGQEYKEQRRHSRKKCNESDGKQRRKSPPNAGLELNFSLPAAMDRTNSCLLLIMLCYF